MIIRIDDSAEWYPVFTLELVGEWGEEVDVDEVTLERWKETFAQFEKVQNEMEDALRAATGRKPRT